jgi:tetratricopeptide (TPR) repeat protein
MRARVVLWALALVSLFATSAPGFSAALHHRSASATANLLFAPSVVVLQRGPISSPIDPELEKMADHNLEVARHYKSRRKAYQGAKDRLLEIVEVYPEYTKIDEVYYLLGEVYFELDDQAQASEFLQRLLKERAESKWAEKAKKLLTRLGRG